MTAADQHPNVIRVVRAATDAGIAIEVQRFVAGTRTAEGAAHAVGCQVAQIVKSLVFLADGRGVVALVSGADRLDPQRLGQTLGVGEVRRADGDEVRAATGYPIGGVPPFGHTNALPVVIDERLFDHDLAKVAGARRAAIAAEPVRADPDRG
jgi:prolyl-tRNA editing enzyme YbaK/EbsC (Cys-tRNA(Pro) deacylase)